MCCAIDVFFTLMKPTAVDISVAQRLHVCLCCLELLLLHQQVHQWPLKSIPSLLCHKMLELHH